MERRLQTTNERRSGWRTDAGSILVVGGYGAVGRITARELTASFPGRVRIAGRDLEKARAVATAMAHLATPLEFDITDRSSFDRVLDGVELAIVCLDQENTSFVEACFERGIDYIDISASNEILEAVEPHAPIARENGTVSFPASVSSPASRISSRTTSSMCATVDDTSICDRVVYVPMTIESTAPKIFQRFETLEFDGRRTDSTLNDVTLGWVSRMDIERRTWHG